MIEFSPENIDRKKLTISENSLGHGCAKNNVDMKCIQTKNHMIKF